MEFYCHFTKFLLLNQQANQAKPDRPFRRHCQNKNKIRIKKKNNNAACCGDDDVVQTLSVVPPQWQPNCCI